MVARQPYAATSVSDPYADGLQQGMQAVADADTLEHSISMWPSQGARASAKGSTPSDADVQVLSDQCKFAPAVTGWDECRSAKRIWGSRYIFKEKFPAQAIKHVRPAGDH